MARSRNARLKVSNNSRIRILCVCEYCNNCWDKTIREHEVLHRLLSAYKKQIKLKKKS